MSSGDCRSARKFSGTGRLTPRPGNVSFDFMDVHGPVSKLRVADVQMRSKCLAVYAFGIHVEVSLLEQLPILCLPRSGELHLMAPASVRHWPFHLEGFGPHYDSCRYVEKILRLLHY